MQEKPYSKIKPIMITWQGQKISLRELSLFTEIPYQTLKGRIDSGMSVRDSVMAGGIKRTKSKREAYTKRKPEKLSTESACAIWEV